MEIRRIWEKFVVSTPQLGTSLLDGGMTSPGYILKCVPITRNTYAHATNATPASSSIARTAAIATFVVALLVLHRIEPLRDWVILNLQLHQLSLVVSVERVAILGLLMSLLAWILVAIVTPAPTYLSQQARALQGRIPEELREHLPKLSA